MGEGRLDFLSDLKTLDRADNEHVGLFICSTHKGIPLDQAPGKIDGQCLPDRGKLVCKRDEPVAGQLKDYAVFARNQSGGPPLGWVDGTGFANNLSGYPF